MSSDIATAFAVTVNAAPHNPRHDYRNQAPNGFEWGYTGNGPT
jgi:hypothetical protein